jgi:hypothetical protein
MVLWVDVTEHFSSCDIRDTHTEEERKEFMMYVVKIYSDAIICKHTFIKIGSSIRKWKFSRA